MIRRRVGWRRTLLALAVTMLCVAFTWGRVSRWLASLEPAILAKLSHEEVESHLRLLAADGEAGVEAVVAALDQHRGIRSAAMRVLSEEIQRVAAAPASKKARLLDPLAEMLASKATDFRGDALLSAAQLAERIVAVSGPLDVSSAERLRRCHIVIAACANERLQQADRTRPKTPGHAAARRALDEDHRRSSGTESAFEYPLFGGGLPISPLVRSPKELANELAAEAKPLNTSQRDAAAEADSLRWAMSTEPSAMLKPVGSTSPHDPAVVASDEYDGPRLAESVTRNRTMAAQQNSYNSSAVSAPRPRSLEFLLGLDDRLRSDVEADVAAARDEMAQLAIGEDQLRLARGAIDSDARVRVELVEALAMIDAIDAREWLLWLSHDRDADVRRAALSLMATSNDPRLKKRVRQAADDDPDSRVREHLRMAINTKNDNAAAREKRARSF